ncbi:MAG: hypothetical protein MUF58_14935 [Arcicella sp.]|jgi:hypothetical protein|nr:hypothetical protein [Arcicella sp.]
MNYSKSKAEKLVKEFDYLKSEKYYPFGTKGKACSILSLEAIPEKFKISGIEVALEINRNKNYIEEQNLKLANGNNWYVKVNIYDGHTEFQNDLSEVLKRLKIANDIDKIPN